MKPSLILHFQTGVVGAVVPLSILAVVAFFYMRHRRQQKAQPQPLNPEELDPYKQRPTSMYAPPATTVPFTPYVSISYGSEPGKRF